MNTPITFLWPIAQLHEHIICLLREGSIAKSRCSAALLRKLEPLLESGVLIEERSGSGRRLTVRDLAALTAFCTLEFPQAELPPDCRTRIAGVAGYRDSKIFAADTPEIICVRCWAEGALTLDHQPTSAVSATREYGMFSFLLRRAAPYSLHTACALVENPVVFTEFEQLQLPVPVVIYGHGRISKRLLDWLSAQDAPGFSLLHLPDYDPVGLSEFERLRGRLGPRVCLHVPRDLRTRFERFANRELLLKLSSQTLLGALRQNAASPQTRQVLELIDAHNAGLEQEALLIPPLNRPAKP